VKSLGITQERIAEVDVFTKTRGERKLNYGIGFEQQVIYLDFHSDNGVSAYELTEINSLVGIAKAVDSYKATTSYQETESGISFNVPIETVINSLSPSLNKAKTIFMQRDLMIPRLIK
jgi:hypothetical protein